MIPHIVLLISGFHDIIQSCFCIPYETMDPNFKIKYILSGFVFNLMEILVTKQIPLFFEAPCMDIDFNESFFMSLENDGKYGPNSRRKKNCTRLLL